MENKIALLIDAENVNSKYIDDIYNEISKFGKVSIARLYGNLVKIDKNWQEKILEYAIKPFHQMKLTSSKNAADMDMALDALSLCYENKINTFFIVSSDSDFTPLAIKLKELGANVIGIGDEKKVTAAFKAACNEFKYFQYYDKTEIKDIDNTSKNKLRLQIENIIIENSENNILQLSRLGEFLINANPDFDPRKYGTSTLSALVLKLGFKIERKDTTAFIVYENKLTIEDVKDFIEDKIKGKKQYLVSKMKQLIEDKYPNFNYKHFGFSKFSLFLKNIGYKTKNNTFTK